MKKVKSSSNYIFRKKAPFFNKGAGSKLHTLLLCFLIIITVGCAAIPKQLFDNKQAGYFNQTPYQFFTSTNFKEVMVMGETVEGDITYFNPDIQLYQKIKIDDASKVVSWEHSEMSGDGLSFLIYHIEGSREAVILKKTSKTGAYALYCTYRVPVGKTVKSFSMSRDLDEIAITTEGGSGSNLFYYSFDKSNASGVISNQKDDMNFSGTNGTPTQVVFGENTIYFSTSTENKIFAYRYKSSGLTLYSKS